MGKASRDVFLQVEELRSLFAFAHLPAHLQEASKPWAALAEQICAEPYWSYQTIEALTNLLRTKDAAVRARVIAQRWVEQGRPMPQNEPEEPEV